MTSATVEPLYRQLLDAWNSRDAAAFAALFTPDGHSIGFDGSEMHGREAIQSALANIFAHHPTARYVPLVREASTIRPDIAILRAHVGMVPPGQQAIKPDVNAVQVVIAVKSDGGWRIRLLQNTPAAYHGRPEAVEQLTKELQAEFEVRRK